MNSNPQMEVIERAFGQIDEALKTGQFTSHELKGIKLFAERVSGATDRALKRGPANE